MNCNLYFLEKTGAAPVAGLLLEDLIARDPHRHESERLKDSDF